MNDLLKLVIDAHGGLNHWNRWNYMSAAVDIGGVLWELKGQAGFARPTRVTVVLHRQKIALSPFLVAGQRACVEPDRVAIQTSDGRVIEERRHPRASFAGHIMTTPWDRIHLAYFAGYAMWTYFTTPFSFAMDGFESREVEPRQENGEIWRGLLVRFPQSIATHSTEQTFYFDAQGLLRRHDYEVDVSKGAKGAHYVYDYDAFGGIMVPTRRRVYVPRPNGNPMPEPLVVSMDLSEVRFT